MLKLIIAPILALCLALGGCNQQNADLVAQVQAALKQACGFELVAATAAAEIAALLGVPGLTTAVDIANAICASVNSQLAQQRRAAVAGMTETVSVKGVTVHGRHVR